MKTASTLLALLLLAGAAPFAAGQVDTVNVTFQVTYAHHALPPETECALAVPAGANAGDVLDAAVAAGCIDSWESAEFAGFGRYVTCIDGLCELPAGTFWAFFVDETPSGTGIDGTFVVDGQTIEFVYADWFTPFLLP